MTAIATQTDLYELALPPGTLGSVEGRIVDSALASTNVFELDEHGFVTDLPVQLRALGGGNLPAPLVAATTYYVIRETSRTFKLAATVGGSAIDLTTDGVSVLVIRELAIDRLLEAYSEMVIDMTPAHARPAASGPYPIQMVRAVCELTARKLQLMTGVVSGSMEEVEKATLLQLQRWAVGIPIRDENASAPTNLAIADSSTAADPRGWGSNCIP